ncbi:MAG: hypothetical protein HY806_07445 [Nitrospirae bacterium]|nr:hypothetical protein [Nitrospirota bacterium]
MELFKQLFLSLNLQSVKYMVAGGIAVNLYGIERATADIDIVLKLDEENIAKFVNIAGELGLKPKLPVKLEDFTSEQKRKDWIKDKGMKVFSLFDSKNSFFLLDVFVDMPFDFDEVYNHREKLQYEDTTIPLVPIKELINMKQKTGRPQDMADVFYLRKISEEWNNEK